MKALEVFTQQNGEVTKAYYAEMQKLGELGEIAVCLFRAQKRSSRAKDYRRGKFRRLAYDAENVEFAGALQGAEAALRKARHWVGMEGRSERTFRRTRFVDSVRGPSDGPVQFPQSIRFDGPDYSGEWSGLPNSADVIIRFCDRVASATMEAVR